jgi:membrane protein DedA with SNARE-associated domain
VDPTLLDWLGRYGPIALCGLLALGVFGLPVPDETLLVIAGTLIGKGRLPPIWTFAAAVAGSSTGITVSYLVGRLVGPPAVRTFGRVVHVSDEMLMRLERWFERIGKWTLMFGYYVPGVRHTTALLAGAARLPVWVFATFAYVGAVLWSAAFLWLGYEVGDNWPAVLEAARRHTGLAAIAAFGLIMGWAWWRARMDRRGNESAPPAP